MTKGFNPIRQRLEGGAKATFKLPAPPPPIVFDGPRKRGSVLQFYGSFHGFDSFANVCGTMARTVASRIDKAGIYNYVGGSLEDPQLKKAEALTPSAPVGVFFGLPQHMPDWFTQHRIRIAILVYEGDRIPMSWVMACNRLDLVIVPSQYCRNVFLESGVTAPVMVVPHGVHPWHKPRYSVKPESDRFVFYNNFRGNQTHKRKSYTELLDAFELAFEGRDDVVMKLRTGNSAFMPRHKAVSGKSRLIELDTRENLAAAEAAACYSEAHCVVHPSKAEGFGLVPLESICSETPVIAPFLTGMADFLREDNAIELPMGPLVRVPNVDHFLGQYYSVDTDQLVDRLRYAVDHYDTEKAKVVSAGQRMRQAYAWDRVLTEFGDTIDAAVQCENRDSFAAVTEKFRDARDTAETFDLLEHRARHGYCETDRPDLVDSTISLPFDNLIYCGWDLPRDGIGNHIRLLDGCVFNIPQIRFRSQDELPSDFDGEAYPYLRPNIHQIRPALFQRGLYLDVIGFQGGEETIYRQIERVNKIRERFNSFCAIYLMWETDKLWAPMLDLLRAYDLTIVTSSLLDGYFAEHRVPHAKLRHPYAFHVPRLAEDGDRNGPLKIGISAGLWARKNLSLATERFAAVLGGNPNVRFVVHTRTVPFDNASKAEAAKIRRLADSHDNIEFVVKSFSREAYIDWMNSLDAYCFISSGEGYSVTPREALHMGKPVFLLDAHVHSEFSHLPGVIPIAAADKVPARPGFAVVGADIGFEFSVNTQDLDRAFADAEILIEEKRGELHRRHAEVLEFHDENSIRNQWLRLFSNLPEVKSEQS